MTGERIVRVKCRSCGSEHNFRNRTEKKAPVSKGPRSAKRENLVKDPARRWEAAMTKAGGGDIPYDMGRTYSEGEVVAHPAFGRGIVLNTAEKKVTILFREKERTLVSAN